MGEGRVTMSWAQVIWAIATIAAIVGSWYDTRTQVALARQELALRVAHDQVEHARMWRAIDDANAAERSQPGR